MEDWEFRMELVEVLRHIRDRNAPRDLLAVELLLTWIALALTWMCFK